MLGRIGVVCVVLLAGSVRAQEVTREEVGRELARVAAIDLTLRETPAPSDYLLAAHILSAASEARPNDAEIARLAAAAAWSAGDRAMLMDATRTIIRADPADTVAQLRLISSNINDRQTIELRIEAYERILGPRGAAIDPAVRSRLALDAALLVRERGDSDGFERLLMQAVELDPTNKDAIALAARTFGNENASIETIVEWQIKLLLSDPFDPHVHLTIARLCAGQGALDAASRFLDNGARLFESNAGEVPAIIRQQRLALNWQRAGAQSVLETLNGPLADLRTQSAEMIKQRQDAGEPHDDIRAPEEIRYDLGIEKVRLLASNAAGDQESVDGSLADMLRSTDELVGEIARLLRTPNVDTNALIQELVRVFGDVQIMRSIMGRDQDKIQTEVDALKQAVPGVARQLESLNPWIAFAETRYDDAIVQAGSPGPGALLQLLIAMASERVGETERASALYRSFALARSLDAYGAFARTRAIALDPQAALISRDGVALERRLAGVPAWVDRLSAEARAFVMLETQAIVGAGGPMDPNRVRIRLRNSSAIPMGLGSSRPIGSRMLIAPRPANEEQGFIGEPTPKVVDLDRRLRLMPREGIEVEVDADAPYTQWLRVVNAHLSQRDRYRVIQSFQPGERGGLVAGPFGLTAESRIVQRTPIELDALSGSALIERIASHDGADLRLALAASLCRLIQSVETLAAIPGERAQIADAWFDRFLDANDDERALMLLWLPQGAQAIEMESFDDRVVGALSAGNAAGETERWTDDRVVIAALLTRVRSPESPLFQIAIESPSDRVRAIALLLRQRLASMHPSYAGVGPGAGAMGPPNGVLGLGDGP